MSYGYSFRQKKLYLIMGSLLAVGAAEASAQSNRENQQTPENFEEVVVLGIRASLSQAIDIKRDAGSIVDGITAEDIGKLPDTTIADSLQRVTGIQIQRSAGEGARLNVRSMPQVSMQLNGESFLSSGSITTAQPDFADVPAELLAGVDVIKSSEASTLSGGVAGTVNLRTRRPLELNEGWTLAGSAEGSRGSYTDDTGHKLSLFAGYNGGRIGGMIGLTNSKAILANYRYGMYTDWWFRGYNEDANWPGRDVPLDLTGDNDTADAVFGTIDYGVTNRSTERDRKGVSAAIQFEASDALTLTGELFYTEMEQFERTNGIIVDNAWASYDWVYPVNPVARTPGESAANPRGFYTASIFDLEALRIMAKSENQSDDRNSLNLNLQADWTVSDSLKTTFRFVHGKAENKHLSNVADANITSGAQHSLNTVVNGVATPANPNGIGPERVPIHGDMSGKYPRFTFPNGFAQDRNTYGLVSTFSHENRDESSELNVLRFDGEWTFDERGSLEFGYRYGAREVERRQFDYVAPFTANDADGNPVTVYSKWKDSGLPVTNGGDTIGKTWTFDELNNFGWIHTVSDFGPASDGNSYYFIDPKAADDPFAFQNRLYPGNIRVENFGRSYIVDEDTHTLYLQGNFSSDWVVPFSGNVGVQMVRTFLDIHLNNTLASQTIEVDGATYPTLSGTPLPYNGTAVRNRSFTDFLPRANIAFDLTEDSKLRFAFTKTLTQLDTNDLGLGLVYTINNNAPLGVFQAVNASQDGNPNMLPWRADNLDISYEYYFGDTGIISAGLYRIDVKTSIVTTQTTTPAIPDSDGVIRDSDGVIALTTRGNDLGGVVQGIELSYQQGFENLPGAWSGLGTTLNYTWADGESAQKDFYGKKLPMSDNSEHQFNAILWYEYEGLQARLAWNYRSERLIGVPSNDGNPAAWWAAPTTFLDASISYDINDNFTIYLQGTNLTEEFEETYMQWKDVLVNQSIFEARYMVGLRARL